MARSNKYASLNFNDIYEKKLTTNNNIKQQQSSSSSSSQSLNSKTIISNSRIHGNMLVLTRPTPKPISHPPLSSPPPSPSPSPLPYNQQQKQQYPDQIRSEKEKSDSISLRPLGHTGSGPSLVQIQSALTSPPIKNKDLLLNLSPTTNRFVPPHLRPGFVGREEKPQAGAGVKVLKHRQGNFVTPSPYGGEEARPKSGGGYEKMKRGFEPDPVVVNRPGSSGARLSSSG